MDLAALRLAVENEIDCYVYEVSSTDIGNPIPADRIAADLEVMRAAFVDPYWEEVELRDTFQQVAADTVLSRKCVVIADDAAGNVLIFDPIENGFSLALRQESGLLSIGVRGDAVGCFMAR